SVHVHIGIGVRLAAYRVPPHRVLAARPHAHVVPPGPTRADARTKPRLYPHAGRRIGVPGWHRLREGETRRDDRACGFAHEEAATVVEVAAPVPSRPVRIGACLGIPRVELENLRA